MDFKRARLALLLLFAGLIAGCTAVLDASDYGLSQAYSNKVVKGSGFKHRVVFKKGVGSRLHVYVDGDGRPWETRIKRSENPTPERALALELMALDEHPALFLGRPCYFVPTVSPCDQNKWWTSHRYSQDVVSSMSAVIDRYSENYDSIALVGHSGGGTIAFLLASQRDDVSVLVTLAANLNIALWAKQHSFSPLYGSLNPVTVPQLDSTVNQFHFLGESDRNVSSAVFTSIAKHQKLARFERLPGLDHSCCWGDAWPDLLAKTGMLR
ncbi:MAG: alpha/beta fold hydrolase [Halioglobus sp.]